MKELVAGDRDLLKPLPKEALPEVLEAEMSELLGAEPSERTHHRRGHRAGYYHRGLVTRIGKLELRVPRDRNGEFSRRSGGARGWCGSFRTVTRVCV